MNIKKIVRKLLVKLAVKKATSAGIDGLGKLEAFLNNEKPNRDKSPDEKLD
jgi:hypothetical protein